MSLILEALRKSEAERRRGSAPDVAMELPPPSTRAPGRAPAWLWPAVAVLALLLAFAAWWSQRGARDDAVEPAATAAMSDDAEVAQAAPSVVARQPAQASAQAPASAQATPAASVQTPPAATARVQTTPPLPTPPAQTVAVRQPAPVEPARPMPPAPMPVATATPPASTGMAGVKLSMHMWNESPSGRFVILNGQRMGEGDRNGDLQVVEILRDGVVVERNGQRARIPLP